MSIAEAWQPMIREKVVVPGRAQFVTFQYHDALIGLLNVYARTMPVLGHGFGRA